MIDALDDEQLSLAEVARRVGDAAQRAGIVRPSPVHVRAVLAELRAQRADDRERRAARVDALSRIATGRVGDAWEIPMSIVRVDERVEERARRRKR